jgi:hypothetical protein
MPEKGGIVSPTLMGFDLPPEHEFNVRIAAVTARIARIYCTVFIDSVTLKFFAYEQNA